MAHGRAILSYVMAGIVATCVPGGAVADPARPAYLPAPLQDKDFPTVDPRQAALGQLLFYDPILSGNRNIACATCHHPDFGTGDGLSLGIGEGGQGLGPDRTPGVGPNRIRKRIPRNAPALWNLGAPMFKVFFHDGRAAVRDTYDNSFDTPAEEWLPDGLDSLLAAQAIFPLTAQFEMAGNPGENEVTGAVHDRIDGAWPILAKRVRVIPGYGRMLQEAFDLDRSEDATIVEIANALAAFMTQEFRSDDSLFDAALRGDLEQMSAAQRRGMDLFYGAAGCVTCHSGPLLTDHGFHAIGVPGFGPGRTRRFDPMPRDVGRMGDSDLLEDMYRFRTPSLRNVALTAPYGHNGAYPTLDGMV
ncbi:MAG: cytochrome-c peroxidase, partial [Paracoccaceae bacterium]